MQKQNVASGIKTRTPTSVQSISVLNDPWFEVDLDKLEQLREVYETTKEIISKEYPINLNSSVQLKDYFRNYLDITLQSIRTAELERHLKDAADNSMKQELIQGIVYFQKMHYALKNYINWILNYTNGRVYLTRDTGNNLILPNKRPLPASPEILECITGAGNGISIIRNNIGEVTGLTYRKGIRI